MRSADPARRAAGSSGWPPSGGARPAWCGSARLASVRCRAARPRSGTGATGTASPAGGARPGRELPAGSSRTAARRSDSRSEWCRRRHCGPRSPLAPAPAHQAAATSAPKGARGSGATDPPVDCVGCLPASVYTRSGCRSCDGRLACGAPTIRRARREYEQCGARQPECNSGSRSRYRRSSQVSETRSWPKLWCGSCSSSRKPTRV